MFNTNAQCYQNISQVLLTSAFILWPTCTRFRYSGKNPMRFAVFWRISVRFCGFQIPLTPPSLTLPGNLFCQESIIWKRRLLLSKTTTQECKKSPFGWRVSLKNAFASCMVYFTWPEETNKNSMYKSKWRAPHPTPFAAIICSWNELSQSWMRGYSPDEHKQ